LSCSSFGSMRRTVDSKSSDERRGGGPCGMVISSGMIISTAGSDSGMLVRPSMTLLGVIVRAGVSEERRGEMCGELTSGLTVATVEMDCRVYSESAGC